MRFLGFGRKPVAAEVVGNNMTSFAIDADKSWEDVCLLRAYSVDGSIATCEMAFAKAALLQSIFIQDFQHDIAVRAIERSNAFVQEAFEDQESLETTKFYGGPLRSVALARVGSYLENALPFTRLAGFLGASLKVPGMPSVEIAPIFEERARRWRKTLDEFKVV